MLAAETRQFKMHQKLLYDVIRRQAGTLSKAVLEAIMNSVDAKATRCTITATPSRIMISDDGQGFRTREEIEQWFEVFGQPHEESEGKRYGTFRMGRGQLFAFGTNTWTTNKFQMEVDIQNKGLDYDLRTVSKVSSGCLIEITLYDRLLPMSLAELERDLEHWVKWCPIPVTFNAQQLSNDPAVVKWDVVTDDAYIKLKPNGTLAVYNLGIHVFDLPGHKYGTGGEVVSRKQVKVNFARNDIQHDCPVWGRVKKLVDARAAEKSSGKKALNDDERQRLADRILTGTLPLDEAMDLKLITAATGRQYPISELLALHSWKQVSNSAKGNRKADKLMKGKVALVVADETLDRFHGRTVQALRKKLETLDPRPHRDWEAMPFTPFETLTAGMSDKYDMLDDEELSPNQQLWLRLIAKGCSKLKCEDREAAYRRIRVGISKTADGWTDGASYICIDKRFIDKTDFNVQGFISMGHLLLHEMCHHSPDLEDHDHDQAFFEEFHEHVDCVADFASTLLACIPSVCESLKKKLTNTMLHNQNQEVRRVEELVKFPNVGFRKP
jgi:hypothetical protein